MWKKLIVIALAVSVVGFASTPRSNAGTEVVETQYAPQQRYNYAPPPPRPVYYAPPRVGIVVYPTFGFGFGYYPRPFRAYGYHRAYGRPFYRHGHHWR